VFVNPLQFGPGEDLDRYPRTLDEDLHALSRGSFGPERALSHPRGAETPAARVVESAAATIVFAPTAAEMYPEGESQTRVTAGAVAELFEGATRPGHFDGMLTVVAKLFGIVQPTV